MSNNTLERSVLYSWRLRTYHSQFSPHSCSHCLACTLRRSRNSPSRLQSSLAHCPTHDRMKQNDRRFNDRLQADACASSRWAASDVVARTVCCSYANSKGVTHLHETSNRTVLTGMAPPRNGRVDLELHDEFPLPVSRRDLLGSFDADARSTHARIP